MIAWRGARWLDAEEHHDNELDQICHRNQSKSYLSEMVTIVGNEKMTKAMMQPNHIPLPFCDRIRP